MAVVEHDEHVAGIDPITFLAALLFGYITFPDTTAVDLSSPHRSALGAHLPQKRSGTPERRTLSASDGLDRNT